MICFWSNHNGDGVISGCWSNQFSTINNLSFQVMFTQHGSNVITVIYRFFLLYSDIRWESVFGSVVQRREGLSDVPVPQGESVELLLLGVRLVLVVLLVLAQVCQWRQRFRHRPVPQLQSVELLGVGGVSVPVRRRRPAVFLLLVLTEVRHRGKCLCHSPVPQLEGIKLLGAVGPVLTVLLRLLLRVLSEVVLQRERLGHRSVSQLELVILFVAAKVSSFAQSFFNLSVPEGESVVFGHLVQETWNTCEACQERQGHAATAAPLQ